MTTETFLIAFAILYILGILYAMYRWPDFFRGNDDDFTMFPPH